MGEKNNVKKRDNGKMKISIKRRYKYFKVHDIIMIICFMAIAMMSGAIAGEYIVDSSISNSGTSATSDKAKPSGTDGTQNSYSSAIKKAAPSLVTISNIKENLDKNQYSDGNITGIVVDKKGYIITNASKIKDFKHIYVKVSSAGAKSVEGKVIATNDTADIAIIKIEFDNLVPIEIATKSNLNEGESVIAIGNASSDDYVGFVTSGIITSTNDNISSEQGDKKYSLLQTNSIINKENTGGPICNMTGELIGFSSESISDSMGKGSLYYGVDSDDLKKLISNLINLRDILGINGGREVELDSGADSGVYIDSLNSEGYAAKAGIKVNDIIVGIGSFKISDPEDIYDALQYKKSGDTVVCVILRDGQKINVKIDFN